MKNILIKSFTSGKWGHASLKYNCRTKMDYIEVRMLDTYEVSETYNIASFYIYFDVFGEEGPNA